MPHTTRPCSKRRTFAGRTLATILAVALSILLQALKIPLVLWPTDVSGMRIGNEHFPLVLRQETWGFSATLLVHAKASPDVRAGVARIVQRLQGTTMLQRSPHQFALANTTPQASGKEQAFFLKELYCRRRRTGALKRLEECP